MTPLLSLLDRLAAAKRRNRFPCAWSLHRYRLAQAWHSSVRVSRREALEPSSQKRTTGRAQLIQPVSLLSPILGTARFPHGTRTLSVSETYVSLGGKHHPFTVHYQPLLLSADSRAAVRSRAITGPLHFTEDPWCFALALPTAPLRDSGRELAVSLAATQAVAFAFASFPY